MQIIGYLPNRGNEIKNFVLSQKLFQDAYALLFLLFHYFRVLGGGSGDVLSVRVLLIAVILQFARH